MKPKDDYAVEWLSFIQEVKSKDGEIIPRLLYKSGDNYSDFTDRVKKGKNRKIYVFSFLFQRMNHKEL